jgi:hypothetical protein
MPAYCFRRELEKNAMNLPVAINGMKLLAVLRQSLAITRG